ncbi:hypothetical protein ES703_80827 [subsurface metagenome]
MIKKMHKVKFVRLELEIDQETYRKLAAIARAKKMSLRKSLLPGILLTYAHLEAI